MITLEHAITALHEAVEEKGADYVYDNGDYDCTYSTHPDPDGHRQPSCIVGHVIAKLDPNAFKEIALNEWTWEDDVEVYVDDEDPFVPSYISGWVADPADVKTISSAHPGLIADEEAVKFLAEAQWHQDCGAAWGVAEKNALKAVNREGE